MQEYVVLTGIVIKAEPIGEYDRRVVILTKERGKVSVFARGARKQNNKLMAPTNPFSFGQFKVYFSRNSYSLAEAEITNYFENLRNDFEAAYYGMYFLEICDYYSRENNDEKEMLKLIYQSLRALSSEKFDNRLVRCVFELKAIVINGEFSSFSVIDYMDEASKYTVNYIINTPVEKLFSFTIKENILKEIEVFSGKLCKSLWDKEFKSLEILENIR